MKHKALVISFAALSATSLTAFAETEYTSWSPGGNGKSRTEAIADAEYWAKKQARNYCRNKGGLVQLSIIKQEVNPSWDKTVYRARVKYTAICGA